MHGLINRSIQCFIRDSYGIEVWQNTCEMAELGFDNFEAMLIYDDAVTDKILSSACAILKREKDELLEDLGTYLVSHLNLEAVRRLLRFGGETYGEFLLSLDELPGRAKLALPDLDFPNLELRDHGAGAFALHFDWDKAGFGTVALGVLRGMADDYGALVLLDHKTEQGKNGEKVIIAIDLLEAQFAQGREFSLGAQV